MLMLTFTSNIYALIKSIQNEQITYVCYQMGHLDFYSKTVNQMVKSQVKAVCSICQKVLLFIIFLKSIKLLLDL